MIRGTTHTVSGARRIKLWMEFIVGRTLVTNIRKIFKDYVFAVYHFTISEVRSYTTIAIKMVNPAFSE